MPDAQIDEGVAIMRAWCRYLGVDDYTTVVVPPDFSKGYLAGRESLTARLLEVEEERQAHSNEAMDQAVRADTAERELQDERFDHAEAKGAFEAAERTVEQLREALRELVRLKGLKEHGDDLAWTQQEKDAAWSAARTVLKVQGPP